MAEQVYYIPHGGGPLPIMGDDSHKGIIDLMRGMEDEVEGSRAIILVTAHWEGQVVLLSGAAKPPLLFDYYNFPPETYRYNYPASGAPALAQEASALLSAASINNQINTERGFDHGTFVPMMLIRPSADIPILQMSLLASLDPDVHIKIGLALSPLVKQGVTIIGSGLSFHNLGAMLGGQMPSRSEDELFDAWLNDTLVGPGFSDAERTTNLVNWSKGPGARFCHPREEHLLPLHVCFGAASGANLEGKNIYRDKLLGFHVSGFRWSVN